MIVHADRRTVAVLRTTANEKYFRTLYICSWKQGARSGHTLQHLEKIRYIFMSAVPGDSCGVYVIG